MAKFCIKCGKPLEEGQTCSCMGASQEVVQPTTVEQPINNAVDSQPVVNQQPINNTVTGQPVQNTTNINMEQTKNFMNNLFGLILNVFKQPYTAAVNYVRTNEMLSAIILFVLQGLLAGITVVTLMNKAINEITNGLGGMVKNTIDLNPVGTVLVVMIASVALSFAYAAILLLASMMFKAQVNYSQCVRIMGVRSVAMIGGTIVAIIIGLLSAGVGAVVALVVVPSVGFIYTVVAFKSCCAIDDNKLVYLLIVYMLVGFIAYYVIALKIGLSNIPIIKEITDGIGDLSSLLGGASNLTNMFN